MRFCHRTRRRMWCSAVVFYCSAVWCSASDTHLKLLDHVVSGACFLAFGVLNCDLSHRRYVAVLCMLNKIRCNPKHPLCGALPVPYVPVWVTRGALIAHRYNLILPCFGPPPKAWEGGPKEHRAKQKWSRETHSITYVPGLSTLSDLSRIVAQPPPSFLCCLRPPSNHPSRLTSVSLVTVPH